MYIGWETIKKFACGTASDEQAREVKRWAAGSPARRRFLNDSIRFYSDDNHAEELLSSADLDAAWQRANPVARRAHYRRSVRWAAASVAVVALLIAARFLMTGDVVESDVLSENSVRITLPDGSSYDIGNTTTDMAIPGFEIADNGNLAQLVTSQPATAADTSHIEISVARGQTYDITLSDGTHVRLNAGSSLRFPSLQAGSERRVALSGEAWFEVAYNPDKPFIVDAAGAAIRVLGTNFNVRAYNNTASSVVLVSGSVEVGTQTENRLLVPGEQCDIDGDSLTIKKADMSTALAWQNDEFAFSDAPLHNITDELARWYDVEVIYQQPELQQERFYVFVGRSQPLTDVMDKIAKTGRISYRIADDRLVIFK
jgi:ferric-dicitrate binding protein FerR (iron transport regulator)